MTADNAHVREIGYVAPSYGTTNTWWMYEGETTPELQWPQSVEIYDAMRKQDAQVGSVLEAVTRPVLRTPWRLNPAGARMEVVEFVADDLSLPIVGQNPTPPPRTKGRFSWLEHLELALLMLPFGHCVDQETEALTQRGWLRQADLQAGDQLLTLNPETGFSEWQPCEEIHRYAGTHAVRRLEGRSHSSVTTLNHRWIVRNHGSGKLRFRTSQELTTNDRILRAAPSASLPIDPKWSDAFVELVAWYWTEGHEVNGGGAAIWQSEDVNGRHCQRIRAALTSLFGPARQSLLHGHGASLHGWREEIRIGGVSKRRVTYWYLDKSAAAELRSIAPRKIVRSEFIASMTAAQLRLFVETSIDADGSRTAGTYRRSVTIGQKDGDRLDAFEMACSLLGIPWSRHPTATGHLTGIGTQAEIRPVYAARRGDGQMTDTFGLVHDGVWCPQVANRTWLARRRGTVYFTGNSYFEQIYRVTEDGSRAHLHKLSPRMPRTIERIDVARDGGLISITQIGTMDQRGPQKPIPVDHLVAYIHKREGGNWLGRSVLRQAYKNWLIKDRLLRVQAQTIERNGMGIPTYEAAETETDLTRGLALATSLRAGEAAGAAIPNGAKLRLMGVEGDLPDALPVIEYHDNQIAHAVLAHFLNLGQQAGTGSYALGVTFADFFTLSLQTLAQQIADVATMHIVEDLVDVNWGPDEPAPRITFDEIGSRQAATAQAIKILIDAGVIQPDDVLEESSRQQYGLPPRDPDTARTPPSASGATWEDQGQFGQSVAAAAEPVVAKFDPHQPRDPGGEGGGEWITTGGVLRDVLKLAGKIRLDDGEELLGSDKISDDYGAVRLAATRRNGRTSLRIGVGDGAFGTREDEVGPWRGDPGSIAEENAKRRALAAEWSALQNGEGAMTSAEQARFAELDDMDLNEIYSSGHTARLEADPASRLRAELADASARAKAAIPAHQAAWDAIPDGTVNADVPFVQVAQGVVPGEWGDVHFDIELEEPAQGPMARLWVVPKGESSQDVLDAELSATLDLRQLDKLVRLLDKLTAATIPVRASARHRRLAYDTDTDALIAALAAATGEVTAAGIDWDPTEHPRGRGGRFRSTFDRVMHSLTEWSKGNGGGDPLPEKDFSREQLRTVARTRGITLKRGATRDEIRDALLADLKVKVRKDRDDPAPELSAKFTLKFGKNRNRDVAVYQEANGKVSLYEESDAGKRGARVAMVDDLAALEKWADDNGEPELKAWAAKERGGDKAPAKKAVPAKADRPFDAVPARQTSTGEAGPVTLNPAERNALDEYANDGQAINSKLRGGGRLSPKMRETVAGVDSAMDRSRLTSDVAVYRGTRTGSSAFGDRLSGDLTGAEWTDFAYLSTSVDDGIATDFARIGSAPLVMKIRVPEGTGAVGLSDAPSGGVSLADGTQIHQLGDGQGEILFERGLQMRVTADHGTVDGIRRIDVEVVPSAKKAAPREGRAVADLPPVRIDVDASSGSDTGRWRAVDVVGMPGASAGLLTAVTRRVRLGDQDLNERLRFPEGRPLEEWQRKLRAGYPDEMKAKLEAQDAEKAARRAATADRDIKAVDQAMRHSRLPMDVVLWRGANPTRIGLPPEGEAVGHEWTDPGFVGASAARDVAEHSFGGKGVLLRVVAPEGTSAISILGGGEEEVLIDRGLRYRVVAEHPRTTAGYRMVDVEVVSNGKGSPAKKASVTKVAPKEAKPSQQELNDTARRVIDAYVKLDERGKPVKRPGFTLNLGAFNDAKLRKLRDDEATLAKWAPDRPSIESVIDSLDKAETVDAPRPADVLFAEWSKRAPAKADAPDLAIFRTMDTEARRDALDERKMDGPDGLKAMLRAAVLLVSGRKRDLVDRLVTHLDQPATRETSAKSAVSSPRVAALNKRLAEIAAEAKPIADVIARAAESKRVPTYNENVDLYRGLDRLKKLREEGSAAARELLDALVERDGQPWGGDSTTDADRWQPVAGGFGTFDSHGTIAPDALQKLRDRYVTSDRNTIEQNASLRSGAPTSTAENWARRMSRFVRSSELAHDTKLYRGAALRPEQVMELRPGAILHDRGIVSTDDNEKGNASSYADTRVGRMPGTIKTMFEIRASKGAAAIAVGYGEVLLDRGGQFRVVSSRMDEDVVVHVVMELVR